MMSLSSHKSLQAARPQLPTPSRPIIVDTANHNKDHYSCRIVKKGFDGMGKFLENVVLHFLLDMISMIVETMKPNVVEKNQFNFLQRLASAGWQTPLFYNLRCFLSLQCIALQCRMWKNKKHALKVTTLKMTYLGQLEITMSRLSAQSSLSFA